MTTELRTTTTLAIIGVIAACGGGDSGGGEAAAPAAAPAATPAVDPAEAGTISGRINFAGDAPAAASIDMSEEPDCAAGYGADGAMTQTVIASGGGLGNVFVYVKEGLSGEFPASETSQVINQENCRYTPHVMGVQTGQTITIRNSDNLLHNVNASPSTNRGFNVSQPRAGIESSQSFAFAEVMVPVRCDVHGWMNAYVGVLEHPFFAVSAADGSYEISGLPAGDYVIEAWHEHYGTQTHNVSVTAQATADVSFDYSADMAGADVPLGDPLVVRHTEDGMTVTRESAAGAAGS